MVLYLCDSLSSDVEVRMSKCGDQVTFKHAIWYLKNPGRDRGCY